MLGESAKVNLLGYEPASGKYVKINDTWLQVIGVLAEQATADSDVEGLEVSDRNNLIIAPLNTVMRRFEDNNSYLKDEIDGIYIKVAPNTNSVETASVVNAILSTTHKEAGDFNVVVPAGLLEHARLRIWRLSRSSCIRTVGTAGGKHLNSLNAVAGGRQARETTCPPSGWRSC